MNASNLFPNRLITVLIFWRGDALIPDDMASGFSTFLDLGQFFAPYAAAIEVDGQARDIF
jgi:hypothetical protein